MLVLPPTFLSKLSHGLNWKLGNLPSGSGNVLNGISEAINKLIGPKISYQLKTIDGLAEDNLVSMVHNQHRPLLMKGCGCSENKPTGPRCPPGSRGKPPSDGKHTRLIIGLIGLMAAVIGAYYLRLEAEDEKATSNKPTETLWSFKTYRK